MLAIFASAAAEGHGGGTGLFDNALVVMIMVLVATYIFLKFCTWAKKFQLSGSVKKWVFILTGLGVVFFNILYSNGNAAVKAGQNGWGGATMALLVALAWVMVFAFVLMAETKTE